MASRSPGLFTNTIKAMASPRSASSAPTRVVEIDGARPIAGRGRTAVGTAPMYPAGPAAYTPP
jgi:hypothetical protein